MNNLETLRERKRLYMLKRDSFNARIQTLNLLIAQEVEDEFIAAQTRQKIQQGPSKIHCQLAMHCEWCVGDTKCAHLKGQAKPRDESK